MHAFASVGNRIDRDGGSGCVEARSAFVPEPGRRGSPDRGTSGESGAAAGARRQDPGAPTQRRASRDGDAHLTENDGLPSAISTD